MHHSSMETMKRLVGEVPWPLEKSLQVLEVGSLNVSGGSYRQLFKGSPVNYVGLDIEVGPGVDVVVDDPYDWRGSDLDPDSIPRWYNGKQWVQRRAIEADSFDLVISGQAFEHIEYPWETMKQIARVLKPHTGIAIIIAPSRGRIHRWPVDTFRYHPDGFRALGAWAELEMTHVEWIEDPKNFWGDCTAVFQKNPTAQDRFRKYDMTEHLKTFDRKLKPNV